MRNNSFCEFPETTGEINEDFFKTVMKLNYYDWRISYRKAQYIYETKIIINGVNYLEKAKEHIDESIQLLSASKETQLDSVIQDLSTLLGLKASRENKVFQLAGQIYAQLANANIIYESQALKYYQKYQVFQQIYKPHNRVQDLSELSVYSFRPVSGYSIADLANETITVSRPSRMNDPFDSLANLWRKTENLKNATKEKGHEKILSQSMDYFRIRSFVLPGETENSVLRNIRMWSAYADEHKGFCVKYKLHKGFINRVDTKNINVRRLAPVKYVNDFTMPNSLTAIDSYKAYNMKHECWSYENEIRLVSYNTSTNSDFFSEPMGDDAKIEEIIFGIFCPEVHRRTIFNILKHQNIKFSQMTHHSEESIYLLKKIDYNPNVI